MNSPKILQTSRRSRGYRSLSNEISGENDTDTLNNANSTNMRRTSITSNSAHLATNLVYNLLSPKYSPVFRATRFKQKLNRKESNRNVNSIYNRQSTISPETSSLESLDSLSSTDLLPSGDIKKVTKKLNKRNSVKERLVEDKINDCRSECKPTNFKDNKYYQRPLNAYKTLQVYDELNDSSPNASSNTIIKGDNKSHEKSGTLHKILLSLPINRIKRDHLCTTQSAPCSPIFLKKEQTNTNQHLFNLERITSPYFKKKNNFRLNPLTKTTTDCNGNRTNTSSSTSPLSTNRKYLKDTLMIHQNHSKCQKSNNNSNSDNKLSSLPLSQLELNIQQFKMINQKLEGNRFSTNHSNQNNDKADIKLSANNDRKHKLEIQNSGSHSLLESKTNLSTSNSEGTRRLETPPPSYSDLKLLNSSSRDHLLTNNADSINSNYTLLSKVPDPLHTHNSLETYKNHLISKSAGGNNADKYEEKSYSGNTHAETDKSTEQTDSYREVILQRHDATERFGMRLERTKGVRQVTYIAMILPRSPAQLAGLKVGDRLIRVNELETDQMLLEELLNYIRKSDGPLYLYYQTRPFTSYLLTTVIRKQNGKIGIKLRSYQNELQIDVVLPNSPASRVGLRSGQQVVSLNGQCVHGWDQLTAMHWFRHYPDGVDLTITVLDELDKTENSGKLKTGRTTTHITTTGDTYSTADNGNIPGSNPSTIFDPLSSPSNKQPILSREFLVHNPDVDVSKEGPSVVSSTSLTTDNFVISDQVSDYAHENNVINPLFPFVEHKHDTRCQSTNLCTLTSCPLKREDRKFYIPNPSVLNVNTCECTTKDRLLPTQGHNDNLISSNHDNSNNLDHQKLNQYTFDHSQLNIQDLHGSPINKSDKVLMETLQSQNKDSINLTKTSDDFESNEKLLCSDSFLQNEFLYKTDCV
ncbi:unnamed protein product [Trichobilharzia szidati]|nr:unnamed protein product [Trichobilharzia szidati]